MSNNIIFEAGNQPVQLRLKSETVCLMHAQMAERRPDQKQQMVNLAELFVLLSNDDGTGVR